jgi:hypothetical protein
MKYMKILVISLIAALGCCASVVASSASAEGGPLWGYCKLGGPDPIWETPDCNEGPRGDEYELALLKTPSETLLLLARGLGTQELVTATAADDINCTALEAHGWALGGDPGTARSTLIYSGCSLPSKPKCDVSSGGSSTLGTITTKELESLLVFLTKAGAEALNPDESGELFRPLGNTGNFVEIELHPLESGGCPINGLASVKGNVLTKIDEPLNEKLLRLILATKPVIKDYFEGMTGEEKEIKKLELAGITASYLGKISVDVQELHGPNVAWWICP